MSVPSKKWEDIVEESEEAGAKSALSGGMAV
jgi:hypothetical protein